MSYPIPTNGHQAGTIPMSHVNYDNQADIPIGNPKEQTFMWQQQSYMVDSGINSGVSTQAPSISGQEDNFESEDVFDWDQNGFTHTGDLQLDQARPQDVRAPMYDEMPSTPFHPNQPTTDIHIAEPPQMPQQPPPPAAPPIINQSNYQLDTDRTIQMISKLIKMLNDKDQVVVNVAASTIAQLPITDVKRHALITEPQILRLVVAATMNSSDLQLRRCTAQTLNDLSHHPEGLIAILNSGSIPAIVELLNSPVESILFLAIVTLHNLLLQQKGSKEEVLRADGLPKLMSLLQRDNAKFLAIVTDCLHSLAHNDTKSKLVILAHQGPVEFVRIMRTYNYEKLLWTTSRVLKVLSICSKNKAAIVEAGGMQALALHLNHQSDRLVMNCLWALRNLSDAATKMEMLDDLLYQLVALLGSNDVKNVVTCAAGIVSNLTCNNQLNKMLVFQAGGVEALLKLIRHFGSYEELAEPTICALRHLTSRHTEAEKAQNAVRLNFGLPAVLNLLQLQGRWPLIKAAIGLVRNLALCPDNRALMREHHTVPRLSQLLIRSYQEIANHGSVEGIRMEDVVEGTVGALHILASDSQSRVIFRELNIIHVFVQLLSYGNENIQRVAAGVLYELAVDKEGAEIIERLDAIKLLRNLCSSKNEDVAMNAVTVLSRISEHKPKDRSSLDQVQSIFDVEEVGTWAQDLASIYYDDPLRQGVQGCQSSSNFNPNHGLEPPFAQGSIGFDQMPIDPLQDFEIGSHQNPNYDLMDSMDIG